jgi:hypothetical protein
MAITANSRHHSPGAARLPGRSGTRAVCQQSARAVRTQAVARSEISSTSSPKLASRRMSRAATRSSSRRLKRRNAFSRAARPPATLAADDDSASISPSERRNGPAPEASRSQNSRGPSRRMSARSWLVAQSCATALRQDGSFSHRCSRPAPSGQADTMRSRLFSAMSASGLFENVVASTGSSASHASEPPTSRRSRRFASAR